MKFKAIKSWDQDSTQPVQLPFSMKDLEEVHAALKHFEQLLPGLIDSGANFAAIWQAISEVTRQVEVALADSSSTVLPMTVGETIIIPKHSQPLLPPAKMAFFLGTFFGILKDRFIFWHPLRGELPVLARNGLPCLNRDVTEDLISELEMAVITYNMSGHITPTDPFPGLAPEHISDAVPHATAATLRLKGDGNDTTIPVMAN